MQDIADDIGRERVARVVDTFYERIQALAVAETGEARRKGRRRGGGSPTRSVFARSARRVTKPS